MALIAIQDEGTVEGDESISLSPAAGEEWNINLILYSVTGSAEQEIEFNGRAIETLDSEETTKFQRLILTNTNTLTISFSDADSSDDFNYYYSGYKKT